MGPDLHGHGPHGFHGPGVLLPLVGILWPVVALLVALWISGYGPLMIASMTAPDPWRARWADAVVRHRAVAAAFAAVECDPRSVLDRPALVDVRQPATAGFVDAFAEARALLTERYPAREIAARFGVAVECEERAWSAAVDAARSAVV